MFTGFLSLLKKDFRLMLSGKILLLAAGSLILYTCYINYIYVNLDQDIYPVYLYDPSGTYGDSHFGLPRVDTLEELQDRITDGYTVGIDASGSAPHIRMISSGAESTDRLRSAYALSLLSAEGYSEAESIGSNDKEMKNRREITCEFLFFELSAVGFLGLASLLFKEKQMGVTRVHGILPVSKAAYILSKLLLFVVSDLLFAALLTLVNLGVPEGITVLPAVLIQAGILSLIMALLGFCFAVLLADFRQFSLVYLVLAIFICTPVFLAGQTGISWDFINYHPVYHLFMAMKNAYFTVTAASPVYYGICAVSAALLFGMAYRALGKEMTKEG